MKRSSSQFLIVAVSILFSQSCLGQGNIDINLTANGTVDRITFYDSLQHQISTINVQDYNPYKKLGLKNTEGHKRRGIDNEYDLSQQDKRQILSRFFSSNKQASKYFDKINFKSARASTFVEPAVNCAVIIYNLGFYDEIGIVGKKSSAVVVNALGKIVSKLPESDNGYFSPAITKNGKYIAFNTGDVTPETQYTLFENPKFQIFNVGSGKEILSISGDEYSLMSPVSFENMLRIVRQKSGDTYEYNIIALDARIRYQKEYSRDQIGTIIAFDPKGIVFRDSSGKERKDYFEKDFTKTSF